MSMREMCVEAAARAIWAELYGDDEPMREGTIERALQLQVSAAALDAILAVLAEPTPEMRNAGEIPIREVAEDHAPHGLIWDQSGEATRKIWQAMLKAIR